MPRRFVQLLPPTVMLSTGVWAQSNGPLETEIDAEMVTVIAPLMDDGKAVESETVLGEVSLIATSQQVLENGLRLRARGALRLQSDHPARVGGIGGFGSDMSAPVGAFSGLSSAAPVRSSDLRARLETTYLQVDGGYGELRVGKDLGVAARFHEGAKSVLSHARLDSSLLDPTGLSSVQTRHDLTGPSGKISYASPRLLGLRAGISYTPELNADGLDRRPASGTNGLSPNLEHAVEVALNATRRLPDSGLRVDLGIGWSTADPNSGDVNGPYTSVETWSAGSRIEQAGWTLGASWLESDNGFQQGHYRAWSTGLFKEAYNTDFSLEYGVSDDDNAGLETQGWRFGAGRDLGRHTRIAVAYLRDEIQSPLETFESQGVVVEITLSQEIIDFTGN